MSSTVLNPQIWGLRLRLRQVRSNQENPAEFGAGVHPGLQQSWILHRSGLILIIDHQCVISYCNYHLTKGLLRHLDGQNTRVPVSTDIPDILNPK